MDDKPSTQTHETDPSKRRNADPPAIDVQLQLKWGLALLGEDKAKQYLEWLREKFNGCDR